MYAVKFLRNLYINLKDFTEISCIISIKAFASLDFTDEKRGISMEHQAKRQFGIIHIGTVNMTLKIIAYSSLDDMEVIENVSREVKYGGEVFTRHHVSFQSLNEICTILNKFKQLLRDYDIKDVRVLSTTAIREADNLLNVIDQIYFRTGFKVTVVRMAKEIYYKFFGLYYHILKGRFNFADKAVLLLDITSGGVGLTSWQSDKLLFQQNMHIGSLRILENFSPKQREELTFPTAAREYICGALSPVWASVRKHDIKYIVLSGRAATLIGKLMHKEEENGVRLIKADELRQFVNSFHGVTPFKLMQRCKLSENLANVIMPTLLLYYELLRSIDVNLLVVMSTTFTEGYSMHYVAEQTENSYVTHQKSLLLNLTRRIAGKYWYDPAHASCVEEFSNILFNAVYKEIGLDFQYGYLLHLASILHEIGKYVNIRKHNLCTYHLIMETDLFGITDEEKEILANIAYYADSGISPQGTTEVFDMLPPEQKVIAAKLVAIFRLADSLDKGHMGKIKRIEAELNGSELLVRYQAELDISLERWTFMKTAVDFAEIFGISPVLVKG